MLDFAIQKTLHRINTVKVNFPEEAEKKGQKFFLVVKLLIDARFGDRRKERRSQFSSNCSYYCAIDFGKLSLVLG